MTSASCDDGETLELAGLEFAVDHTPGHTAGSVIFRSQDRLFSGDLLFRGVDRAHRSAGRVV